MSMLAVAQLLFALHWAGSVLAFLHCNALGGVCIGFSSVLVFTVSDQLSKVGSLSSSSLSGSPPSLSGTCRRWNWSAFNLKSQFGIPGSF